MRFCLALLATLTPSLAFAQMDAGTSTMADAGMMEDGGMPDAGGCGSITLAGECRGNVVVFCDELNDEIIEIDCPLEYGPTAICQEIDQEYGVDCAIATGDACIYEDEGVYYTDFCQGTNAGCVETLEDATCQENVGPCTPDEVGTCRGALLIYDCNINQPWVLDCASFSGTCDDDHCTVPSGSLCDDDVLVCEPGAICAQTGFCETVEVPDSGVVDSGSGGGPGADAGVSGGEEDEGCGCTTSQNDRGSPYLLLLVAAWFILRRRGRSA